MSDINNPYFSIVIPSYNREKLILKAINSVVQQSFKDYEIIIADDCSTDNTREVVNGLSIPNLHFFQNEVNKGNAGARNLGAKNAKGKYICYLDSDDQYHPNFLEKMYDLIQNHNEPGFLWCNVNRIDENGNKLDHSAPSKWKPMEADDPYVFFLNGLYFGTDFGFTVRKDCFQKTGYFDENLRAAVDTDFMLRLVQDFDFAHTLDVLVDTYDHSGPRVRKDSSQKLRSYKIMLKKHQHIIDEYVHLQQRWYYKLMWLSYHNNQKKDARSYLKKSISCGNKKATVAAVLFEVFPVDTAIRLHKKISEKL